METNFPNRKSVCMYVCIIGVDSFSEVLVLAIDKSIWKKSNKRVGQNKIKQQPKINDDDKWNCDEK